MKKTALFVLLILVAAGLGFYLYNRRNTDAISSNNISIRLKWLHQAQFAGYYVADKKGFFKEEGLTAAIKPGGVEFPSIPAVANGSDLFGVTAADQIILQ